MSARSLRGTSVLVVDDNEHMLTLVGTILGAFGVESVGTASNARDALAHLRSIATDLMICDLDMKPTDGIALVRMVRSANGSLDPALPIIMLSAHEEPENVAAARDAGVDAYMIKPVSVRALYEYVIAVMAGRGAG
ncbi:MAG: response regulator [Alphaproteobacteria bacterium]